MHREPSCISHKCMNAYSLWKSNHLKVKTLLSRACGWWKVMDSLQRAEEALLYLGES